MTRVETPERVYLTRYPLQCVMESQYVQHYKVHLFKSVAILMNTLFTIPFGKTLMVLTLLNQLTVVLILL